MLFYMYDLFFFAEENEIDWEQHSDRVHPLRGNNPQPSTELRPSLRLSQQPHETPQVAICDASLGGHKRFPCLIVDIHGRISAIR
jgi:hypothetical protein